MGAIVGHHITNDAELLRAVTTLHNSGVENVIVGLNEIGAYASSREMSSFIAPLSAPMVDVTGAGDAAFAAALWALGTRQDVVAASKIGQVAAALTIATLDTVSSKMSVECLMKPTLAF